MPGGRRTRPRGEQVFPYRRMSGSKPRRVIMVVATRRQRGDLPAGIKTSTDLELQRGGGARCRPGAGWPGRGGDGCLRMQQAEGEQLRGPAGVVLSPPDRPAPIAPGLAAPLFWQI